MSSTSSDGSGNKCVLFGHSVPECSLLKTVALCVCFNLVYLILPVASLVVPAFYIVRGALWQKGVAVGAVSLYALTFDGSHKKSGRPWPWIVNNPFFKWVFEWLPLRLLRTSELPPEKRYVFACHPHGALAFNRGAVGFCTDALWNAAFPGVKFRVLTATAAFFVPLIRELWLWSYCVDASKTTAVRVMEKEKCSVFVYPGGEKEQMETVRGKHIIYLKQRKGFVKLAMQQGAQLVPVYAFGECDLYNHYQFGIGFRKMLVEKFGVAVPLISGQFGLLPYRRPVTLVFGAPIEVAHVAEPTREQLDAAHALYMDRLLALFNAHKESMGYASAELEII